MPELKETIARHWLIHFEDADMRPEVFTDEAAARNRYADLLLNWNCHLFCATEEVEKLRADKERLDRLESNVSRRDVADMLRADVFSSIRDLIDRTLRILDPQDAARSLQTSGRVPESTAEAKTKETI